MIFIAILIGCILGALIGMNAPMISYTYSSYLAIAVIAALDSVFGGINSVINKNFDLNFTKLDDKWQLVLNPKRDVIKKHLNSVTIDGSKDIDRIFIDTVNSGETEILFECGKE